MPRDEIFRGTTRIIRLNKSKALSLKNYNAY